MSFSVKTKFSLTRKKFTDEINGVVFTKGAARSIGKEIKDHVKSGKSPVKGKLFKQYSTSYANRKKGGQRKPVTMSDTGDMLKDLKVTATRSSFRILWDNKIADIHNRLGAGRSKVIRRLLPNSGESFAVGLMNKINKAIERFKR